MGTHRLICHPDTPSRHFASLEAETGWHEGLLWLRYHLGGALDGLEIPAQANPARRDGLWKHTCFEVFIDGEGYSEFNFSPSGEWAAYDFAGYRQGMRQRVMASPPAIALDAGAGHFALEAVFDPGRLNGRLGLSAVIEETDGTKSYWALAHPPGNPDFHHPACFAATLPAPSDP